MNENTPISDIFNAPVASQNHLRVLGTQTSTRAHKSLIGEVYRREMILSGIWGAYWIRDFDGGGLSVDEPDFTESLVITLLEIERTELIIRLLECEARKSNYRHRREAISLALRGEGEHRENLLQHKENMS